MTAPYWQDDTCSLLLGDALDILRELPDGSVHCCVTSPPYYGLRDYGTEGQIGLEASPSEYVERLRQVFAEVRRVLADDGTLWLNLGDSYVSRADASAGASSRRDKADCLPPRVNTTATAAPKNLLGIPWLVAFALQADGWILRSDIIWAKRNIMPEAVTDRPTRTHEHVFLLTKQGRYWYDADAIREASAQDDHNQRYAREYDVHTSRAADTGQPGNVNNVGIHSRPGKGGRNSRDVWTISQTPSPQAHFATFPVELPVRCIKAGSRIGATVLDPFSGSGTTGEASRQLGRRYIGIDLNGSYHDLAIKRYAQGVLELTS